MNMLETFPMPLPKYPQFGVHYGLIWWTHDKQQQLCLAPTMRGLLATWKAVLAKTSSYLLAPEIRQAWKFNIIEPPKEYQVAWAQRQYENELENFKIHLKYEVKYFFEEHGVYPDGLKPCLNWEFDAEYFRDYLLDKEQLDIFYRRHSYCKHCGDNEGFFLANDITYQQLYEAKRDVYLTNIADRKNSDAIASKAKTDGPMAIVGKPIYVVVGDFGHHCDGIKVNRMNIKETHGFSELLFFCHAKRIKIPKVISTATDEFNRIRQAEFDEQKRLNEEQQANENQKRSEKRDRFLKEIFNEQKE